MTQSDNRRGKNGFTHFLTGTAIPTAILLVVSLLMLFPLYWLFRSALMTPAELFRKPMQWLPAVPQWQNFVDIMELRPFMTWLGNSAVVVTFNVIGAVLSSSMVAFALARLKYPGRDFLFGLIVAAMLIPGATLLIPQFLIWNYLGFVGTYVPLIWGSFGAPGLYTFMLRQFYKGIPMDIDEAARVDGANPFHIFSRIIFPMSKAPLVTVAIFTFANVWNDFMGPLIYLSDELKYTAALGLRSFVGLYTGKWHYLMAASVVLVLPMLVLFALAQRVFIRGINLSGGLKG